MNLFNMRKELKSLIPYLHLVLDMLVTNQYGKRLQFVPLVKIIGQNHQLGQ